jgi:hypothetical protein
LTYVYGPYDYFGTYNDDGEYILPEDNDKVQMFVNDNKDVVFKAHEKIMKYYPEAFTDDEKNFTNYWRKNRYNFSYTNYFRGSAGHGYIFRHMYFMEYLRREGDEYEEKQMWRYFQRFFELFKEKEKRGEKKEKRTEKQNYTVSTWQEFVKKYRDENPGMTYKRAMIEASESWNNMKSNSNIKEDKQERDFKEDKQERDFKEDNRAEERRRANREAMKKADEEAKAIAGTEAKAIAPGNCVFTCPVCNTSYNIIHSMIDKKNIPLRIPKTKIAEAKKQQPEKAPPQKAKIEPDRKSRAFPKESKILTKGDLYNIRGPDAPEPLTWIQHVKRYRETHNGVSYKQALKDAKTSYERVKIMKTRNKGLIRALDL